VHQNNTYLFWKAPRQANGQLPEVLRLGRSEFCVLNSVPWVKLRSYLDWLEGSPELSGSDDDVDVAGTVHHYSRLLAEVVGIPAQLHDDVEILPPDRLKSGGILSRLKIAGAAGPLARHVVAFQRTGYISETGTLLLPSISTNSLSEAASYLLWHASGKGGSKEAEQDSRRWIAQFLVGYLGSKLLNPKRKCNEVSDLRSKLLPRRNAEVPRRALALLRPYLKDKKLPLRSKPLRGPKEVEACRLAGYVLGERFFLSLLKDPRQLSLVRAWYQCGSPAGYRALLGKTAAKLARISPVSKRERF
jgi:hypothetical protein